MQRPGETTAVALIGSGFIAAVHLQVLGLLRGVKVVALVDPDLAKAERLAAAHGVRRTHRDLDELLAAGGIDAVHVLVPPPLHFEVTERCLQAGLHVLVEKPMVLQSEQFGVLQALAEQRRCVLAVNHNQVFHPAVERLRNLVMLRRLGRLEHVAMLHNVPLRQLQTGDVGHFMFRTEANILWEQGTHLFSVLHELLGECRGATVHTDPGLELPSGVRFRREWHAALQCERGTASVQMAFGRAMPEMSIVAVGSDGVAHVDLVRGSCLLRCKTRWLEPLDHARNLAAGGLHLLRRGFRAVSGYAAGLFRLGFPDDPFLRGMRGSLGAFHRALRGQGPLPAALQSGAAVHEYCQQVAVAAGASRQPVDRGPLPAPGAARRGEVVVLGGTGFLGRHCVRQLREQGKPLTLVVRRPQLLPAALRDGNVRLFVGDAGDRDVLRQALAGADCVLHLATCAGDAPERAERAMTDAVAACAETCRELGVRRMVYASSTAALWLGGAGTIDGRAAPDALPEQRSAYARAKIAAERELTAHRSAGLDVVVVRPAIVVGDGGSPDHSGVGLWVRDNQCIGWGRGDTPLPLVLAGDCAQALVAALWAVEPQPGYNLAGDVRLSAREYVRELGVQTGRDYRFHAQGIWWMWWQELVKFAIKKLARRRAELPSRRDLRSRSFRTNLDCSDAKRDLGFRPVADRAQFVDRWLGGGA